VLGGYILLPGDKVQYLAMGHADACSGSGMAMLSEGAMVIEDT